MLLQAAGEKRKEPSAAAEWSSQPAGTEGGEKGPKRARLEAAASQAADAFMADSEDEDVEVAPDQNSSAGDVALTEIDTESCSTSGL